MFWKKIKKIDKKFHKLLIWTVIWSSIVWIGLLSRTKKWKNIVSKIKNEVLKVKNFLKLWFDEFKKKIIIKKR